MKVQRKLLQTKEKDKYNSFRFAFVLHEIVRLFSSKYCERFGYASPAIASSSSLNVAKVFTENNVFKAGDGLMHFIWKDRTTGQNETVSSQVKFSEQRSGPYNL